MNNGFEFPNKISKQALARIDVAEAGGVVHPLLIRNPRTHGSFSNQFPVRVGNVRETINKADSTERNGYEH